MENYTDKQLQEFEKLKDNLIIWMYHNTNDSHPILETIKKAFEFGKKEANKKRSKR